VHLAAVDLEAARLLDGVRDVLRGDRAEQAAVVAGLLADRDDRAVEDRGLLLGGQLGLLLGAFGGGGLDLRLLEEPFVAGWASLRGTRKLRR
jgi:hypothetical protein